MIAVDSNVLLRRVLDDEPEQSDRARRLFELTDTVLIPDIVLAETIWTLKGKRYNASNQDLATMILVLLAEPNVDFESREAIWWAVDDFLSVITPESGKAVPADLTDALIVSKARIVAQGRGEQFDGTFTFDRAALALRGMKQA